MSKYEEKITDNSLWYTATPTPLTLTLPFYITEAGHFRAEADYKWNVTNTTVIFYCTQ